MARQSIPFDGFPAPAGTTVKNDWRGVHFGPSNYQAGGYNLNASALGINGFEFVNTSPFSQNNGTYFTRLYWPLSTGNNDNRAVPPSYVTAKWYYAANSVEVANNTNLSAEAVQLWASGI
jgi:hypothetical protein